MAMTRPTQLPSLPFAGHTPVVELPGDAPGNIMALQHLLDFPYRGSAMGEILEGGLVEIARYPPSASINMQYGPCPELGNFDIKCTMMPAPTVTHKQIEFLTIIRHRVQHCPLLQALCRHRYRLWVSAEASFQVDRSPPQAESGQGS